MARYTWRGIPGLISNPSKWSPSGLAGPNDIAQIATGLAFAEGSHSLPTVYLGNPTPQDAPTLTLIDVPTIGVSVSDPTGYKPEYANLVTIGTNDITGGVGSASMGEPDSSILTVRNFGSLEFGTSQTGTTSPIFFYAPSHLTIDQSPNASISGEVASDNLVVNGGRVANATLNTTVGYHNGIGDLNLANTTLGSNVTITLFSAGDPPFAQGATAEIGNASASDTININIGTVTLEKTLSFLHPPPETINIQNSLYADTTNELIFKSAPFTSASYANGILTLDLVNGHTLPLNVNLQGSPPPAGWEIVQSTPSNGIVTAILAPDSGTSFFQPPMPPGSTVLHITGAPGA